jgi:hypothetical protein
MHVGNSTPGPSLHTTVGLLQQSLSIVHDSPRFAPVHDPQSIGSLVQAPLTHAQPQQSASAVHAPPSATHIEPQRRTPIESGTQIPPQHTSPKSHSAPIGRQHSIAPPRPGAHVMSGYVSMQQSAVVMHSRPGRTHMPSPPRQRLTPVVAGSHPKSPPPFGQQFDVAPAPPHTSPAGWHEPVFTQRMIGLPSGDVPVIAQLPEQHCELALHGSSCTKQPPSGWQVGVPVPDASRQAVVQHEPLKPSVPHGSPATAQAPVVAHWPTIAPPG